MFVGKILVKRYIYLSRQQPVYNLKLKTLIYFRMSYKIQCLFFFLFLCKFFHFLYL